jgi:peptide/nickel transport system permease protein
MPKFVLLWTDAAMGLMALALLGYAVTVWRKPGLAATGTRSSATPRRCRPR